MPEMGVKKEATKEGKTRKCGRVAFHSLDRDEFFAPHDLSPKRDKNKFLTAFSLNAFMFPQKNPIERTEKYQIIKVRLVYIGISFRSKLKTLVSPSRTKFINAAKSESLPRTRFISRNVSFL